MQATRSLMRMKLPEHLVAKLKSRRICTAGELLSRSKLDLLELLEDVCLTDIEQLIKTVSLKVAVANTTVLRSLVLLSCSASLDFFFEMCNWCITLVLQLLPANTLGRWEDLCSTFFSAHTILLSSTDFNSMLRRQL